MMLRNQFSQLLAAGLGEIFTEFLSQTMRESTVDRVFNMETSQAAYEDEVVMAGLGPMPEKTEADGFEYQSLVEGGSKRFVHLTYGLGSRYSWELAQDDQYGLVKQVPKALVRSGNFTREQVPWNIFNLGFTTITTSDGETLFNNQHPLLGGPPATAVGPGVSNHISAAGTYPNRPATDMDLSFTALQTMSFHFQRLIDSMGIPVVYTPKFLIIPPELQYIAEEILGSEGKPYTANNEKNVLKGMLEIVIVPYLTSRTAWFVACEKDMHHLKFYNRHPLSQDMDDDFDTQALKHIAFQRFSAGAKTWLGLWGTSGP
jgi:hypothetical protein